MKTATIVKYVVLLIVAIILFQIPKDENLSNLSALLLTTLIGAITTFGSEILKGVILKYKDTPYQTKVHRNIIGGAIGGFIVGLLSIIL